MRKRDAKYLSKCNLKEPQEGPEANEESGRKLARDLREECDAFLEVDSEVSVEVQTGVDFDLQQVRINKHRPDTKEYRIFTYKNPRSKRYIKVLKCDHVGCKKWFRKWHNFFDHLRIHTNERPYVCDFPDCGFSFTQRANLNKHLEVHGGVKRFECPDCHKSFYTNFNLKSHQKTHEPKADSNPRKKSVSDSDY